MCVSEQFSRVCVCIVCVLSALVGQRVCIHAAQHVLIGLGALIQPPRLLASFLLTQLAGEVVGGGRTGHAVAVEDTVAGMTGCVGGQERIAEGGRQGGTVRGQATKEIPTGLSPAPVCAYVLSRSAMIFLSLL